jgi:hypothetical protein
LQTIEKSSDFFKNRIVETPKSIEKETKKKGKEMSTHLDQGYVCPRGAKSLRL